MLALITALGLLIPAAAAADVPAEPAPPALSVNDDGFVLLADDLQEATVSVGSTEGFVAAPPGQLGDWGSGAMDPNDPRWFSGTSGATGMWGIAGLKGTTFTIDSCGSSFPVQLAVYPQGDFRDSITSQAAYSSDGCANPITLPYAALRLSHQRGLVRVDDASGAGGEYQVNYRRTPLPETTPPRVRAFKPVVGPVRRPKGARRVGMAKLSIDFRAVDADGSYPVKLHCALDEQRVKPCYAKRATLNFRRVPSGRHTFEITGTDAAGNEASFQRTFRVPYLKPKRSR